MNLYEEHCRQWHSHDRFCLIPIGVTPEFQERVWNWCQTTFDGIAEWASDKERSYRFLEEAVELFQAMHLEKEDALKIVDYVFSRPVGEKSQEVGGVMITLLSLAAQQGIDINKSLSDEFHRISDTEIKQKIRAKQIAKRQAFL